MTNQERAEKIVAELNLEDRFDQEDFKDVVDLITSQLDEAVQVAIADFSKDANIVLETSVDAARVESFASAREKAAGIIEEIDDCPCHGSPVNCKTWIAWERIRAMVP